MLAGAVDASCLPIRYWSQDTVPFQRGGDLFRPKAVQRHLINPVNNSGGFLVHNPAFGIVRVLDVTVRRLPHRFSGISFDLIANTPFFADITGIPLVEHALFGKVKTKKQNLSIHTGLRRSGSRPNPLSNLKKPAE